MYDKGVHPDPTTAAECEIERLEGLLCEARGGLRRALEFNAGTPEGLAIKRDVRSALERSDPNWLPPGVAAAAVAETMRWLPEEHRKAVGEIRAAKQAERSDYNHDLAATAQDADACAPTNAEGRHWLDSLP